MTSTVSQPARAAANATKQEDTRRNLYVLGLPFDFTKYARFLVLKQPNLILPRAEFAALFASYGTISHCVILATRDSASRRRGFVVMSTHEEAETAMNALSRKPIK